MGTRGRALTLVGRSRSASWQARALIACAACIALAPGLASAAPKPVIPTINPPAPANPAAPPPDDGLSGGGFYIEADELSQDETTNKVVARGHVEARYQGRTLRADEVTYDSATGVVVAKGDITIINPDGSAEFSQEATLDKDLSQGVALAFSSRLKDNIKIAAGSVNRQSPLHAELTDVIFTPCPVCAKNPNPTWSIRARKAVEDKKRQIIYFRDVVIEVRGLPVFYMPVFWQADPSVDRKSGLLVPSITTSHSRGFSWQQPYLQVISPSEDLVISPQFDTEVNPFLNLDWRKRFYSGRLEVRAGYTYEQDFDSNGNKLGDLTSRSYVLGNGQFDIDSHWKWGFTAERASDPLIFDKYAVDDPFEDHGLYSADDRRLISQLYTTRQDQDSYFSIAAISVQGLRADDVNSTFPTIAPLIEAHYEPEAGFLGGRLRIDGSGVVLTRDQSPEDPGEPGVDSRRATLQADWQRSFILPGGIRIDPYIQGRADLYSLSNVPTPYAPNATIPRAFGTVGFNLSWPFFKRTGPLTWIVEPIAQLALSPVVHQDPRIPIEDSTDFEFDATNLFQADKSPGYDLVDSGQRLTLGGEATAQFDDGRNVSLVAGRVFRAQPDPDLPARTGLATTASDWIFGGEATPLKGLDVFARARLNSGTFVINRLEVGADVDTTRVTGQIRYLEEAQDPTGAKVKDIDFSGQFFVTQHWGITAYGAREFEAGAWRRRDIGVVYRDDCIRVEVVYRRDETFNRTWGPSDGVNVRLTLATLGNSGYRANSDTPSP
jgi:LPS-assembly protein